MNQELLKRFNQMLKPIEAVAHAVGKGFDLLQASPELSNWMSHGRTELAAGLFSGQANSFIMYQKVPPANANQQQQEQQEQKQEQKHELKQSFGLHP